MNGELSEKATEILTREVFTKQKRLQELIFSNLKNQTVNQKHLNEILEAIECGPLKLRRLKLSRMSLHDSGMFEHLRGVVMGKLQEIDLSWTSLRIHQFQRLGEAIRDSSYLQSVNLSYINLSDISHRSSDRNQKQQGVEAMVSDLATFISESRDLMHLSLNGMGLSSNMILRIVKEGIVKSKTLVGVHLSDNEIKEGSKLRQEIC